MKTNVYALFWITKASVPHLKPGAPGPIWTPLQEAGR